MHILNKQCAHEDVTMAKEVRGRLNGSSVGGSRVISEASWESPGHFGGSQEKYGVF